MRNLIVERGVRSVPKLVSPYARQRILQARRCYATVTDLSRLPQPGSKHFGYTLRQTKHVPELELSALLFTHDKTGAEHLHVARDDTNNVFCIGFKTNPPDATGVPHILEHVTLCGSEKYPVRDPFFKMLPRSLNNFMNAFTTTDHTMYPIATTNKKDYNNLVSMYLDSTLHPLLKKSDFLQEGWRIGPENSQAGQETVAQDLLFKGVVYNEMKGQFSDATYLYYMRWLQDIFPSLQFYGGDPQFIPDLTWEQLRAFHKKNYHPSNSKILTYGDTPVLEHLSLIGPQLDRFERSSADTDLKYPREIEPEAQDVVIRGPLDAMLGSDAQGRSSLTWLMGHTKDIHETFALRVATALLLDGYGSPLYQTLIEKMKLGTDFTANTGYDSSSARGIFAVGLNGMSEARLWQLKPAILHTVQQAVKDGFDEQKIDGLLHQLELGLKHKTAAFGLDLINRLTPSWFNGISPLDALEWTSIVNTFRARHKEGGYLQDLLQRYLLDQPCSTFTMLPDVAYSDDLTTAESERLQTKIQHEISTQGGEDTAVQHLQEQEVRLAQEQTSGQDQSLDCLPTLSVADIARKGENHPLEASTMSSGARLLSRITHTNGLTYFQAIIPLSLDDSMRPLMPLFTDCLTRLGTPDRAMGEYEDLIKLKTGGISFSYHATPSATDSSTAEEGLRISGYAMDNNFSSLLELAISLLHKTDFKADASRPLIMQLLKASASGAIDAVAEGGHMYARQFAGAGLSKYESMTEQVSGISQLETVAQLASYGENSTELNSLVECLTNLQQAISSRLDSSSRLALVCGRESIDGQRRILEDVLKASQVASTDASLSTTLLNPQQPQQGQSFITLPFQVYYSGLALPSFGYTDAGSPPLAVLAQLLTHKHLHFEIREKGGAYGAGATSRGLNGTFAMYSYRDPNPENTVSTMRNAGNWALNRTFAAQELEEAKLSLFQGIDAPRAVSEEGMVEFATGVTHEMAQQRRELLLDVTESQVKDAALWLNEQLQSGKYNLAVLGPKKDPLSGDWHARQLNLPEIGA